MTRYLGDSWMLPGTDAFTKRFFTAGQLLFQACAKCGHVQHPPTDVCGECQAFEFTERASAGLGRIESLTVAHYTVHPALKERVPYVVVLVCIDDVPGVRVIGNVLNRAPSEVRVGQSVRVCFEEAKDPESGEVLRIPQWEVVVEVLVLHRGHPLAGGGGRILPKTGPCRHSETVPAGASAPAEPRIPSTQPPWLTGTGPRQQTVDGSPLYSSNLFRGNSHMNTKIALAAALAALALAGCAKKAEAVEQAAEAAADAAAAAGQAADAAADAAAASGEAADAAATDAAGAAVDAAGPATAEAASDAVQAAGETVEKAGEKMQEAAK